jgi:glycosyltransferase involved in cell wall biosynthesis
MKSMAAAARKYQGLGVENVPRSSKEMIRVLHVIDSLELGGAQTALLNLLKYSDRAFHQEVATMHGRGMFWDAFCDLGVRVHSLSPAKWPPAYVPNLVRLLRHGKFDVVHHHLFASNWIAKPLAAVSGVGVLYSHDQCNDAFRSRAIGATFVDTLTNRLSTRVLAVSRSIERFLLDVEAMPAERVTYLPNSVDLGVFKPATPAERAAAKARLGLDPTRRVVGGIGRLTHQKNFAAFIEAARLIAEDLPEVDFVLFGSGPDEMALRELAGPLGGRFRFMGPVMDRPVMYHAIDAMVLPSRYEGLPLTLLEAMASGIPVVATAVDGVAEIVVDGKTGRLVSTGSATALAGAIQRIVRDELLASRIALSALESVRLNFDARQMAAALGALYVYDFEEWKRTARDA